MNRRESLLSLLVGPSLAKQLVAKFPLEDELTEEKLFSEILETPPPSNYVDIRTADGKVLYSCPLEMHNITLNPGDTLDVTIKVTFNL